jgi:hypothetical protein
MGLGRVKTLRWADTTTPHGRLILTVLGGLAEFERHLIVASTGEARKRAKARGVPFGRPFKLTPHQRREAITRREWRRDADRHRPFLQRQPQHDQPLALDRGASFLGREEFQVGSRVQQWGNIPRVSWPRRLDVSATARRGT